jgi:hypothetical protein
LKIKSITKTENAEGLGNKIFQNIQQSKIDYNWKKKDAKIKELRNTTSNNKSSEKENRVSKEITQESFSEIKETIHEMNFHNKENVL